MSVAERNDLSSDEIMSFSDLPRSNIAENDIQERPPLELDEIVVIEDVEKAKEVVERLLAYDREQLHGVDTEVADINLSKVGPVGNGRVTCITIYSGPEMKYDGINKGKTLFIDTTVDGVMEIFSDWFQDDTIKKVWHNYGFDRHVLNNHNIHLGGFAGDTMHMARLLDAARQRTSGGEGYSLESLSADYLGFGKKEKKISLKQLFGIKSATLDIADLQSNPQTRPQFICYAAYDAKCTLELRNKLARALEIQEWIPIIDTHKSKNSILNMYEFYQKYFIPFGELLTDMEQIGIYVDKNHFLANIEKQAIKDHDDCLRTFREWSVEILGPDGYFLNPASSTQIQTLLFGGFTNPANGKTLESEKVFDAFPMLLQDEDWPAGLDRPHEDETDQRVERLRLEPFLQRAKVAHLKDALTHRGLSTAGSKNDLIERLRAYGKGDKTDPSRVSSTISDNADPVLHIESSLSLEQIKLELSGAKTALSIEQIDNMKMKELRQAVSDCGGQTKGANKRKDDVKKRLLATLLAQARQSSTENNFSTENNSKHVDSAQDKVMDVYSSLDTKSLRAHLLARGISPPEARDDVLEILRKDEAFVRELRKQQRELNKENEPMAEIIESTAEDIITANERADEWFELPVAKPSKKSKITVYAVTDQLQATKFTASGYPSVTAAVLTELAGTEDKPGPAYGAFGGGDRGTRACQALRSLCRMSSIDKMLNTFIRPLRELADEQNRVHCSLNLNTETGRLSSRKPNLQNQPALEKDMYSIRKAFRAAPGKKLVVADYGQLELRLLAAITKCKSMLKAFEEGGCFHSRTAVGMFDHVKKAVDNNEVLLERGSGNEHDDRPLVKDKFGSERRKAKTLNFSIAYGKTAHGLAKDWDVTREVAQGLLNAWYKDRPEVKTWQENVIKKAKKDGYTTTLMGRRRQLPDIQSSQRKLVSRGERAAINTPIQGSAADIVMMAMLKLHNNKELRQLDWKLLLQIHDEVILEGPEKSADEALSIIRSCMENPYDELALKKLDVALTVDAKTAYDWYEAK
mmetsp:Transcript_2053/g.3152  ORF Transcript_2053/g.3152 Transcript_2053/m.3152 type:complete len:1034 (+) Transcript_2053:232-3333(+)|eukprot:CAMPEP_0197311082 /NCGR_PEP_ID=MMETSP0891-20130614/9607_1 /TAXON_ID=44058 ORGANISM="Aureoumbra lagunensis, Strain CCMP1510" /NCGR_SAMPLE_ID=MMETSP0891 /ASSEMBLY_ACC=CAM_ASM_000534 /LENGTH=1033 /DNA_ID=CAMNT_0042797029 /DNA_START=216 /DNA_END=3317 /DNA_ORIENTATION=+